MDYFETLNAVYKPLCDKATEINRELKNEGFQTTLQFHNNHSVKRNNVFITECFPIPVIFIENVGSIGVDIDSIWFEAVLPKEKAISIDYAKITSRYKIEIYGSENFLSDLYSEQIDMSDIIKNISDSSDVNICVLFYLGLDVTCDDLIRVAQLFEAQS